MKPITHTSTQDKDYVKCLSQAKTLEQLLRVLEDFMEIANDALEHCPIGLKKEREGEFCGEAFMEKFGCVLLPELILIVGMYAQQFKVPFGLMFIRMREAEHIKYSDDTQPFAYVVKQKGEPL